MKINKIWVVTKPTGHSTLNDILFSRTVPEMALQFRGGLSENEIVACFTEQGEASIFAHDLLETQNLDRSTMHPIFAKIFSDFGIK